MSPAGQLRAVQSALEYLPALGGLGLPALFLDFDESEWASRRAQPERDS
jgi:hypothetical protein